MTMRVGLTSFLALAATLGGAHCGSSGSSGNGPGTPDGGAGDSAAAGDALGDGPDAVADAGSSATCDAAAPHADGGACFSHGHWKVDNIEPCFLTTPGDGGTAASVGYASTPGNPVTCPIDQNTGVVLPPGCSTDTLTADCAGSYSLCYALKAGDSKNPQPGDCVLAKVCTAAAHYDIAGAPQSFPALPAWETNASQDGCIQQFMATGGYGVMSVSGQADDCEMVARDFQSVTYCPLTCNGANPPPGCATCIDAAAVPSDPSRVTSARGRSHKHHTEILKIPSGGEGSRTPWIACTVGVASRPAASARFTAARPRPEPLVSLSVTVRRDGFSSSWRSRESTAPC